MTTARRSLLNPEKPVHGKSYRLHFRIRDDETGEPLKKWGVAKGLIVSCQWSEDLPWNAGSVIDAKGAKRIGVETKPGTGSIFLSMTETAAPQVIIALTSPLEKSGITYMTIFPEVRELFEVDAMPGEEEENDANADI